MFSAVVEHWPTRADIYIESSPPFCLEIQPRSTSFEARTRARESRGARVCWLIRDGLNTPSANGGGGRAQAVRFRVIDDRRRVAQPWRDPHGSVRADSAHIEVFMAIAARPRDWLKPGEPWFRADGHMNVRQFLDEILSGRRRPYDKLELGLRQALWALDTDVADYRAFRKAMAARQVTRPVTQQVKLLLRAPFRRPSEQASAPRPRCESKQPRAWHGGFAKLRLGWRH